MRHRVTVNGIQTVDCDDDFLVGMEEPETSAIAPARTNAIVAAAGTRIGKLPVREQAWNRYQNEGHGLHSRRQQMMQQAILMNASCMMARRSKRMRSRRTLCSQPMVHSTTQRVLPRPLAVRLLAAGDLGGDVHRMGMTWDDLTRR